MLALPQEIAFSSTSAKPVPAGIRMAARERIAHFVELANQELSAGLSMPTCSFDLRGTTAGKALTGKVSKLPGGKRVIERMWHVQLNAVLIMENYETFMADIIPHEVAHLVTRKLHGSKVAAHGPEWQQVMRAFGLQPKRCHSMDVSNARAVQSFELACSCKTFELPLGKFKKALRGIVICAKCKGPLAYTGRMKPPGEPWREASLQALGYSAFATRAPARAPQSAPAARPSTPLPQASGHRPGAPAPTPGQVPSPVSLKFALALAERLGWTLSEEDRRSQIAVSAFIDRAKLAKAQQAASREAHGRFPAQLPTEKQLAFARTLAQRKGLVLPPAVQHDRTALSRWIDAQL